MTTTTRVLFVLLLLASTGVLMADYAAHWDTHRPYPTVSEVSDDYEDHVGEHVYSWVRVDRVTDEGFVVGQRGRPITVVSDANDVSPGDQVQVFGVVRPDRRIEAERVFVSGHLHRMYMFAVSLAGLLWTTVLFARFWRVDVRGVAVRPRGRRD